MPASASKPFDGARFEALCVERGLRFGRPIVAVETTGSTNDDALGAAREGAAEGSLFVAETQLHGRGRRGHRWTSPPGENLLFSLVLRPDVSIEHVGLMALVVGLAVRAALARRISEPSMVKWPNDVLVRERKIAGILIETQVTGSRLGAVVAGVGINVSMRDLPAEIAGTATSLALLGATNEDRETLLVDFLEEFERRYESFLSGRASPLVAELRTCDALLGKPVRVDELVGTGAGIDDSGALLLRNASGAVHRVTSGAVAQENDS